jgi:hypothetical protein
MGVLSFLLSTKTALVLVLCVIEDTSDLTKGFQVTFIDDDIAVKGHIFRIVHELEEGLGLLLGTDLNFVIVQAVLDLEDLMASFPGSSLMSLCWRVADGAWAL